MLLRVREELLIDYACPHHSPGDPRCPTCRYIRERIGFEEHVHLLTTNTEYQHIWGDKLRAELRLYRIARIAPWTDLAVSIGFYIEALVACIYALAISHSLHGSYQNVWRMALAGALAVLLYFLQRYLRKQFA